MTENVHRKHSIWVGVGEKVISFVVGLIVAAFFLGGARARVAALGKDMEAWKAEWKTEHQPRIERIDRQGSISFDNFHAAYLKEQAQQYERIKKLEEEVNHLETMTYRIERLERNHNQPKPE